LPTDLATSEGLDHPVPVSQIIGTIAVPAPFTSGSSTEAPFYPDAPNLHWGLVLLFEFCTFGVFSIVWGIVLSSWMKKIEPQSKAIFYYISAAVLLALTFIAGFIAGLNHDSSAYTPIFQLLYAIAALVARFSLRNSMEQHYNSAEPMGLSLSGVMTFFFGTIYFQYHINDIIRRKRADRVYQMA
jgi:hypothetical protein